MFRVTISTLNHRFALPMNSALFRLPLWIACTLPWLAATAELPIVDDNALRKALRDHLGQAVDEERAMSGEAVSKATAEAPREVELKLPEVEPATGPPRYETLARSVFILGSIYNCGKCDDWHNGGGATAWALTGDGVMVTNHHVFEKATGDAWGVCSFDGEVFPIVEILASNPEEDLAIFRVDTGGAAVRPLPLAHGAPVGARVTMVSHPEGRHFFQTTGEVARYLRAPVRGSEATRTWMSITADYAKGSSGGPAVDDSGAVVGIAAVTQSIYYGAPVDGKREQGPLQMVIKNCVPVTALRQMIRD